MVIFKMVDCPVCGNPTKVRSDYAVQRCSNCCRNFTVNFVFSKHGRLNVEVSMEEFIPDFKRGRGRGKTDRRIMTRSEWEARDIYG